MTGNNGSLQSKVCVEICVDSLNSVANVVKGIEKAIYESSLQSFEHVWALHKVDVRLELCSSLYQGGLTPTAGFILAVAQFLDAQALTLASTSSSEKEKKRSEVAAAVISRIRCRAMLRPHPGLQYAVSLNDMQTISAELNALYLLCQFATTPSQSSPPLRLEGVVFGALVRDVSESPLKYRVDTDSVRSVIDYMYHCTPFRKMTLHRAVDELGDADQEAITVPHIEEVARTCSGIVDCILTSGCAATAEQGINTISTLAKCVSPLGVNVMPGAGVTAKNVAMLLDATRAGSAGTQYIHLSAKRIVHNQPEPSSETYVEVDPDVLADVLAETVKWIQGQTQA